MAVNLSPIWGAGAQLLDNSGNVLTGGKIYTYAAGTTTPATTYTSSSGGTANSNPIILNSAGRVPYEIWLTDGVSYKFVLKDSNDTLIATYDNLSGINSNFIAYTAQQEIQTATAGQTVFNLTTMQYQPGTNNLAVYVDGVNQYGPGAQYAFVETDSDTVTFVSGLHVGASVKFTTATPVASSATDAENVSYTPPFTGAVGTNVEAKLAQTVSVKDFGAVGDGVTDDTAAIQAAIDAVIANGGGSLYVPTGNYLVSADTLTYDTSDISLIIYGDGPSASIISCNETGTILTVDLTASNTSYFSLRDVMLNGGGDAVSTVALSLSELSQAAIENVTIQNVSTGIVLAQVFNTTFKNLRFRNYITGITGSTGASANNNTFINCYFSDGYSVAPATAKPIVSYNMSYNTYINCDFQSSGLIAQVDMTGGSGQDTMIGCRFERLNAGTSSWLKVGDWQQYINCSWHVSGTYNCVGTAYYIIQIDGRNNKLDGVNISNSNYTSNTLLMSDTAKENYVRFLAFDATNPYDTVYKPVTDYSQGNNIVEFPGGGCQSSDNSAIWSTWGGGPVNQFCWNSTNLGQFTLDGLTNSGYASGASPNGVGPFGDGYSNNITSPTGNQKAYIQFNMTAGYVYIFSIFVLPKTNNDTVELSAGLVLGSPTWKSFTMPSTSKWQRIFITYKAPSSSVGYFQVHVNGASGIYLSAPQLEEWPGNSGRFGPAGYVRSSTPTGGQNYSASCTPEKPNKAQMFGTQIPVVGRYTRGDIVWNLDAASGGTPGWVCVESGSSGVWKAMANLA